MDEGGDLGFDFTKTKTSRYFVMTFLLVYNKKPLEKIVKKLFYGLTKKQIKKSGGILHAVQELPETNSKFLQLCSKQKDIKIMALYIKKTPSYNPNSNEKHILYNHIASILLKKLVEKKILSTNESIEFIASRRETKKMLNTMFISCLWETAKKANLNIKISIKPPQEEKGLQVVDVLCWSIYQKYEHQQQYYSSIIASQIIILEELKNPIRTLP